MFKKKILSDKLVKLKAKTATYSKQQSRPLTPTPSSVPVLVTLKWASSSIYHSQCHCLFEEGPETTKQICEEEL